MKRIAIFPLALLVISAGSLKSQAPVPGDVAASLGKLIGTNKTLIDAQQKTLEGLNELQQNADQLRTFTKRS